MAKPTKQDIKLANELKKALEDSNLSLRDRVSIQADLKKLSSAEMRSAIEYLKNLKKVNEEETKNLKVKKEQVKQQDELANLEDALIDKVSILQKGLKGNLRNFKDIGKETAGIVDDLVKKYDAELKSGKLTKLAHKELTGAAQEAARMAKNMEAISENESLTATFESAMDLSDQLADSVQGMFSKIPGGDIIFKALGGDKLKDNLKGATAEGMASMGKSMAQGKKGMDAMNAGMGGFMKSMKGSSGMMSRMGPLLSNPWTAAAVVILAAVAAVVIFIKKIFELTVAQNKQIKAQAKAANVSVAVAKQQVLQARDAVTSTGNQLAGLQDVLDVQNEINATMKSSAVMNGENANAVANVGIAMGMGAQEAGKAAASYIQMGAAADDVANMMMETNLMSVKAGVDMGKVQKDIAANAGKVSKYFAGNPKALAKAAVQAAKMGMSLESMANVADNLLDFEKSIQAQFELQALTGKNINFDKARALALEGDIAGASKEVLKQVGSIHDFNKMDYLERKKLAEASGMSVEELQKSLTIQSMKGKLTEAEMAAAQGLNLSAAELKNLTAEDLQNKLAAQDATAKLAAAQNQMKETMMKVLQPFIDIMNMVLKILVPIGKLAMILGVIMSPMIMGILIVVGMVKSIFKAFEPLFDIIDEIGSLFGGGGGLLTGLMKIGEIIGDYILMPFTMVFKILKAVLMPAIQNLKNIFGVVGEAVNKIKAAFTGGGGGGGKGFGDILAKIGSFMSKFLEVPLKIITWIIADVLVPAILMILQPFIMIRDMISMIGDALYEFFIAPIDSAIEKLGNLNPMNWFSSDDEPGAVVEAMAKGGTSKGGLTLVGEEGPELVTLPGGAKVAPAGETDSLLGGVTDLAKKLFSFTPAGMAIGALSGKGGAEEEGGGGGLGDLAKKAFSFTPMGMAANAIGSFFGKDEEEDKEKTNKDDLLLKKLDEVILAIQNMEINMDGAKVGKMTRLADSYRR